MALEQVQDECADLLKKLELERASAAASHDEYSRSAKMLAEARAAGVAHAKEAERLELELAESKKARCPS